MDYNIVNEKDQVCLLVAGASEFSVVYMQVLVILFINPNNLF